jgi:predicted NUDIX family phosphoesterase
MTVIEICEAILRHSDQPLDSSRIEQLAKVYGYINNNESMRASISARLSEDIKRNSGKSKFSRFSHGYFGLREWLNRSEYREYIIREPINNKMSEILAVFPKKYISHFTEHNGITVSDLSTRPFIDICEPMVRYEAENNYENIQLVSSFVVRFENQILCFMRSKSLPEKRLSNVKSLNFGGHIEYKEILGLFDAFDPQSDIPWIERELTEEINISSYYNITPIGYLYDGNTTLGQQHLGLIYDVELSNKFVEINEKRFFYNLSFVNIYTLIDTINDYDSWSQYIINFYKRNSVRFRRFNL